ncbi:MAG: pyridoxal phosphate-dependent aminotransferase [bacterium]|uniref:Aminotransferase n=2 Tax=Bacteria candidate phyla TaxID=1783234 RepID=A0A124G0J7_UNCT6|nr:MAG: Aminotransferase class I and II [candidate division TA06 bacterium 32_111]KUK87672.1 MAG: Aminotransferase class I and II [candidate division TA06 bacterium 34_109]MDI6699806.1 pyridoxal phosphate-dependent aminotransferase [bacterium]HAF07511.1 aspartate aminotransferase [candidate division WOR-3 bacterium]HCP17580.1 pyridoxal phosphate-dependent aminotransferase [candidate division WOR-3 bacterium]
MKISERVNSMQESPIRKLLSYSDDAKSRGIKVYHLNIGQPDIPTPNYIYDAIKNYSERVLAYGPSQGLKVARETVADYLNGLGYGVNPNEVFITTGGSEAIIFAMMAVADPGDEIIIPEPFYTNYNGFASMAGLKVVPLLTKVETGFHLPDEKEFEKLITSKTRAILVCTPNNPTGTIFTKDEMEMVVNIAKKHKIFVLSDEVYREFVFDNKKHTSVLEVEGSEENSIMLDSISKRFSACGARIGYLVTKNRNALNGILKLGQARLCPPTIEQIGMIEGYKNMKSFMKEMITEYQKRRDVVYENLKNVEGVFTRKPEGAFYVVVKLPVDDADNFAKWMLTDFEVDGKTVMVAPANGFYASPDKGKDEVRIAYVLNTVELEDAIKILSLGIKEYNKRKR